MDVLVLDDEIGVLRAMTRTLSVLAPVRIETCSDPREALEILRARPPKVLVTDYRMPEMNGVEVLREALRLCPETVRILLTGQADRDQVIEAINAGKIYRFVAKPWDNQAFASLVAEAIDEYDGALARRDAFHQADLERQQLTAAVGAVGEIQRSVLPAGKIQTIGADTACSYTPCEHATGDYVDALMLPSGRTALIVGDVCGHGLGAALFVFTARALIRSGLSDGHELGRTLERTNQFLCRDMTDGRFLTLFVGIHDPQRGVLTYANGGHTPPFLVHDGRAIELCRTALPLGVDDAFGYDEVAEVPLRPGDTLFAYTDGVIEARNRDREFFGEERLRRLLLATAGARPEELLATVREAVLAFTEGAADDDLTLLAFRPEKAGVPALAGARP